MRVVIVNTPSAPRRANRKSRGRARSAAAADKGETEKDVIAARAPRPIVDAHAVFRRDDRGREGACVAGRRGHGKPHAASTWLSGRPDRLGDT